MECGRQAMGHDVVLPDILRKAIEGYVSESALTLTRHNTRYNALHSIPHTHNIHKQHTIHTTLTTLTAPDTQSIGVAPRRPPQA